MSRDRMSDIERCPECEAAWERGHKAGRAFQVAQGTDNWKAMHAALTVENERLDNQLRGAVEAIAAHRAAIERIGTVSVADDESRARAQAKHEADLALWRYGGSSS